MKTTYYFSHDYNSRTDPKIKKLISKHGYLGYGLFWALVEDLYNNANAMLTDYESIAFDLHTQCDVIKSVINDFDLFIIKDVSFSSNAVKNRLNKSFLKSEQAKDAAKIRWAK